MPPERYPSEALRRVAEAAYGLFEKTGQISGRDLIALMQEQVLSEEAANVLALEISQEEAPKRAETCLDALERADYKVESSERRSRLKNATPEEEAKVLEELMEARRRRPHDHGLLPGR